MSSEPHLCAFTGLQLRTVESFIKPIFSVVTEMHTIRI